MINLSNSINIQPSKVSAADAAMRRSASMESITRHAPNYANSRSQTVNFRGQPEQLYGANPLEDNSEIVLSSYLSSVDLPLGNRVLAERFPVADAEHFPVVNNIVAIINDALALLDFDDFAILDEAAPPLQNNNMEIADNTHAEVTLTDIYRDFSFHRLRMSDIITSVNYARVQQYNQVTLEINTFASVVDSTQFKNRSEAAYRIGGVEHCIDSINEFLGAAHRNLRS